MPRYDYRCCVCGSVSTKFVRYEDRAKDGKCECGSIAKYEFPVGAALGVQTMEPYYDEALGCDIHGPRHKARVMRAQGVQEAGDTVRGARNFDEDAPHHVKPLPLQGIEYAPNIKSDASMGVETENSRGEWSDADTKDL